MNQQAAFISWKHASNSITRATIEVSAEALARTSDFFDELFAFAFDELQLATLEVRVCPCETSNSAMRAVTRLSQPKE